MARNYAARAAPIGGREPAITQAGAFGTTEGRKYPSSIPHGGVDFNYPVGQTGINLKHPALRSPVAGIMTTNPGDGHFGRITIRDKNGLSHEILHTHGQFLKAGDPVAAGQLIGTMGNTGTSQYHVHYQLKDPAGNKLNPTTFWDQQGPVDPNPAPPALLPEYRQYLQRLGIDTGDGFGNAPGAASPPVASLAPPREASSLSQSDSLKARFERWASSPASIPPQTADDRSESFGHRYGDWGSVPAGNFGAADTALLGALERHRAAIPDSPPSMAASTPPLSADTSSAYVFDPTKPPPPFTPQNYAAAYSNNNRWIASLAGIEPEDPTEFSPPPIFSPFYRH